MPSRTLYMRIRVSAFPPTQRSRSSRQNTIDQVGRTDPEGSSRLGGTLRLSLIPLLSTFPSFTVTSMAEPRGPNAGGSGSRPRLEDGDAERHTGTARQ